MSEKNDFNLVLRAYLSIGAVVIVISLILLSMVGLDGEYGRIVPHWAITGILAGATLIELSLGGFFGLTANLLRKRFVRNKYCHLAISTLLVSLVNIILASLVVAMVFGDTYVRSNIVENSALSALFLATFVAIYALNMKLGSADTDNSD